MQWLLISVKVIFVAYFHLCPVNVIINYKHNSKQKKREVQIPVLGKNLQNKNFNLVGF